MRGVWSYEYLWFLMYIMYIVDCISYDRSTSFKNFRQSFDTAKGLNLQVVKALSFWCLHFQAVATNLCAEHLAGNFIRIPPSAKRKISPAPSHMHAVQCCVLRVPRAQTYLEIYKVKLDKSWSTLTESSMACFNFTEAGTTVQDTNLMKFKRYSNTEHTISVHVPCQHMSGTLILYLLHSLRVVTEVMYRASNGHHPNHTLYECYILLHSSKKQGTCQAEVPLRMSCLVDLIASKCIRRHCDHLWHPQ